ncbi:histidine kinase [Mucilaginibacter yixingensis]|uniref:Oxygen sensor histidine kinase NreB n=1 Tax=Mucilaginibacter yixingensis TaxID=1295612 RepID=A0A2T5JBJ4_9SPHI|nr:histidine kinase [Mucilaginibacter yixingensis]
MYVHIRYNFIAQGKLFPEIVGIAGLLIATFAIAFLVFFIFSRRQQNRLVVRQKHMQKEFDNQLMQAKVEVQEQTFGELGRELHDNVGQLLSSAKLLLGITQRKLSDPPETLMTAQDTLGQALQSLRSLSKSLNTEWLSQFNLIENLHVEAERINAAGQLQVHVKSDAEQLSMQADQQLMLFRIVQEAMNNSIKHAQAKNIWMTISSGRNNLKISIADDGQGFDMNARPGGVGMMNMRHRVKLLNGRVEWRSEIGRGTTIEITLPL